MDLDIESTFQWKGPGNGLQETALIHLTSPEFQSPQTTDNIRELKFRIAIE